MESKRVNSKTARVSARQSARGRTASQRARDDAAVAQGGTPSTRETRVSRRSSRIGIRSWEVWVCLGGLLILGLICGIYYVSKASAHRQKELFAKTLDKYFDDAFESANNKFIAAESVGAKFCLGEDADRDPGDEAAKKRLEDRLFGPFRNDDTVYNVIYSRSYKKNQKTYPDQRFLYDGRTKWGLTPKQKTVKDVSLQMASVEDGSKKLTLFTAKKNYMPTNKEDKVNLGGEITVVVKVDDPPSK